MLKGTTIFYDSGTVSTTWREINQDERFKKYYLQENNVSMDIFIYDVDFDQFV